mgnify:CR=1
MLDISTFMVRPDFVQFVVKV